MVRNGVAIMAVQVGVSALRAQSIAQMKILCITLKILRVSKDDMVPKTHLSQSGRHLICQSTSHNHHVGLTRRGTKHNTHALHIISRSGSVHHLDSAACKSEGHGPKRTFSGPVHQVVNLGHHVLCEQEVRKCGISLGGVSLHFNKL